MPDDLTSTHRSSLLVQFPKADAAWIRRPVLGAHRPSTELKAVISQLKQAMLHFKSPLTLNFWILDVFYNGKRPKLFETRFMTKICNMLDQLALYTRLG